MKKDRCRRPAMSDAARLLLALQMGDSAFPSGGFAFSWGLETLKAEGLAVDGGGVLAFARTQLARRWATADRVWLRRAATATAVADLAALDREVEAMTLARELRQGSRRAGRSLLRAHASSPSPTVAGYRAAVAAGRALGHLPAVQGAVWRAVGLDMAAIEAVSAWTLAAAIAQTAVRLALMGPLEAQAMLATLRGEMAGLLESRPPSRPHAFAPAAEIAAMRHETGTARLFAN